MCGFHRGGEQSMCTPWPTRGGQRATLWGWFSSSPFTWAMGIVGKAH